MTDHLIIYSDRGLSIQKWLVHRTKTRPSCRISPLGMEHPAQAKRPHNPQSGSEAAAATLEVRGYRPQSPSLIQLCSLHSLTHSKSQSAKQFRTWENYRAPAWSLLSLWEEVDLPGPFDLDLIHLISNILNNKQTKLWSGNAIMTCPKGVGRRETGS